MKPSHVLHLYHNTERFSVEAGAYVQHYKGQFSVILDDLLYKFLVLSAVYLASPLAIIFFKSRAKGQSRSNYIKGAQLITADELKRQIFKTDKPTYLKIGSTVLPVDSEVRHAFIVGKPGSGKTVLLSSVFNSLKDRGDRGVVYDYKGDYVSKFYNPEKDILFNPLDRRCCGWSVMNEIKTAMDIDSIAHSLIPQAYQADPFWNDAARDVLSGILHGLYHQGLRGNKDIWGAVTAPGQEIAHMLNDVPGGERGYRYIEDASSKQALSVFSVLMQYVKSFEYMARADGGFCIEQWLQEGKGWIYVTNYSLVQDTLRPILSLFVDLLGRKMLSLEDDDKRRIFFLLDEFGTLQRLSTIVRLLTLSRSKGGSVWIGIQDIGQIDKLYTEPLRQAIINACGNSIIFSVADPKTASFLSDKIGETVYVKTDETISMGVEDHKDGVSLSKRQHQEKLVLASEIMNLRDLECYVKLPNYDIAKTTLSYKDYSVNESPLEVREDLVLDTIVASHQHNKKEQDRAKETAVKLQNGHDKNNTTAIESSRPTVGK